MRVRREYQAHGLAQEDDEVLADEVVGSGQQEVGNGDVEEGEDANERKGREVGHG
jgi:hypothetical protein